MDQRSELWSSLSEDGDEMDLGTVVRIILSSQAMWHAFSLFANSVITSKEMREREWEGEASHNVSSSST